MTKFGRKFQIQFSFKKKILIIWRMTLTLQ
ncbi:unnamed protein product [Larinioides sclopetarius]|uniref:Uncharacterized protein n=1 Tax=Larinioides sclopetarius TaxID=280406 RepID=A0AAV2BEA8_9ARAC